MMKLRGDQRASEQVRGWCLVFGMVLDNCQASANAFVKDVARRSSLNYISKKGPSPRITWAYPRTTLEPMDS